MPHPFFIIHNILTKIERCTKGVFSNLKVPQPLIYLASRENHQMLPWHTKSTRMLIIYLLKCRELPCFVDFCVLAKNYIKSAICNTYRNPNSVAQMKGWLSDNGIETESIDKKAVKELLTDADKTTTEVLTFLHNRLLTNIICFIQPFICL